MCAPESDAHLSTLGGVRRHLILEEALLPFPQRTIAEAERMIGVFEEIVSLGRGSTWRTALACPSTGPPRRWNRTPFFAFHDVRAGGPRETFLARAEVLARDGGFSGFRWGADMNWLRRDGIGPAELFSFEARLNSFLEEHPIAGFCQYSMADFSAEFLIAAAETHPLLLYNFLVCDNFYYVPPEEYLNPRYADARLKRMLFNIITRERLMHRFLS